MQINWQNSTEFRKIRKNSENSENSDVFRVFRSFRRIPRISFYSFPIVEAGMEHLLADTALRHKTLLLMLQQFVQHIGRLMNQCDAQVCQFFLIQPLHQFGVLSCELIRLYVLPHGLITRMRRVPLDQMPRTLRWSS